jgi:hypothetical protein
MFSNIFFKNRYYGEGYYHKGHGRRGRHLSCRNISTPGDGRGNRHTGFWMLPVLRISRQAHLLAYLGIKLPGKVSPGVTVWNNLRTITVMNQK